MHVNICATKGPRPTDLGTVPAVPLRRVVPRAVIARVVAKHRVALPLGLLASQHVAHVLRGPEAARGG